MPDKNAGYYEEPPKKIYQKKKFWIFVIIIISIWIILGGLYFWTKSQEEKPKASYWDPSPTQTQLPQNIDQKPGEETNLTGSKLTPAPEKQKEEEELPRSFLCYIKKTETEFGNYYISVDYIEWLTGEEAKQAALEAGKCEILENCAPQGYYIKNDSELIKKFQLDKNADIHMQTYSKKPDGGFNFDQKISLQQFWEIFKEYSEKTFLKQAPYTIKVKDGKIIEIREKFVPELQK